MLLTRSEMSRKRLRGDKAGIKDEVVVVRAAWRVCRVVDGLCESVNASWKERKAVEKGTTTHAFEMMARLALCLKRTTKALHRNPTDLSDHLHHNQHVLLHLL